MLRGLFVDINYLFLFFFFFVFAGKPPAAQFSLVSFFFFVFVVVFFAQFLMCLVVDRFLICVFCLFFGMFGTSKCLFLVIVYGWSPIYLV